LSEEQRKTFRDAAYNTWKEKFNADINYPAFVEKLISLKKGNNWINHASRLI